MSHDDDKYPDVITGLTPDQIRSLPDIEFLRIMQPLITRTANRSFIPGYDFDDKTQEISVILLKCRSLFNPADPTKAGHKGKHSSFMNYCIRALRNYLGKLDYSSKKQVFVATRMECIACLETTEPRRFARCVKCGGKRWRLIRSGFAASVDVLKDASISWEPSIGADTSFESEDLVDSVLVLLPLSIRDQAEDYLLGYGALTDEIRDSIRAAVLAHPGIIPMGHQTQVV